MERTTDATKMMSLPDSIEQQTGEIIDKPMSKLPGQHSTSYILIFILLFSVPSPLPSSQIFSTTAN